MNCHVLDNLNNDWKENGKELVDVALSTPHRFRNAVKVWVEKPQVVNRRLCGVRIVFRSIYLDECLNFIFSSSNELVNVKRETWCHSLKQQMQKILHVDVGKYAEDAKVGSNSFHSDFELYIRELLPKAPERFGAIKDLVILGIVACYAL